MPEAVAAWDLVSENLNPNKTFQWTEKPPLNFTSVLIN
jgi:hypothetical protein